VDLWESFKRQVNWIPIEEYSDYQKSMRRSLSTYRKGYCRGELPKRVNGYYTHDYSLGRDSYFYRVDGAISSLGTSSCTMGTEYWE
jgi:hypothetical protein